MNVGIECLVSSPATKTVKRGFCLTDGGVVDVVTICCVESEKPWVRGEK